MTMRTLVGVFLVATTLALSGCTGDFEVQQTEPIRVQVEGEPERVQVSQSDPDPERIVVENPGQAEAVDVEVTVTRTSESPVNVLIIIEDAEGSELTRDEIRVSTSDETSENTTTTTQTSAQNDTESGDSVTQDIHVDVKGKDNFVVLTQAQEGDADVDIAAQDASGSGSIDGNATTE